MHAMNARHHRQPPRSTWIFLALIMALAQWGVGGEPPAAGEQAAEPYLLVLGIAQDGGYPQAGCHKQCCREVQADPQQRRMVTALAVIDPRAAQRWIIDATPDFAEQLRMMDLQAPPDSLPGIDGIFLTHAHIGHYTGLMQLGHEAMGAKQIAVHAMPRMRRFLASNGPWDQLVRYKNILLKPLAGDSTIILNKRLRITPLLVPHRDEYSETVGFRIEGPRRQVLFIPDIDKWERWERRIEEILPSVDIAYLDGTFFANGEIPGRDMSAIPHPFIEESLRRLGPLPADERARVRFIHLNHTNPVLNAKDPARQRIVDMGFRVAEQGERVPL